MIPKILISTVALNLASAALANGISPWTPAAGSGEAEISYTRQHADDFNPGDARAPLPARLSQYSVLLSVSYGIAQRLTADIKIGDAKTGFVTDPVWSPDGGLDGLNDVFIGIRYKMLDEADGAPFTATLGLAGIIDGDYTTGALSAIGDGGSGGQAGVALGRSIGPVSLSGSIGHRTRSNNIPDEVFGALNASISPVSGVLLYGGVSFADSTSGIDIGGPAFSPARFSEVEEDYKILSGGASASLADAISANIGYGQKFDGRNTVRSEFLRVGLSYSSNHSVAGQGRVA